MSLSLAEDIADPVADPAHMRRIYVDHTHLGRHVTGLERITLELFSREALAPLDIIPITARGRSGMVARQTFGLPWAAAAHREALVLCPGFPPSLLLMLFGPRVVPYIHDLFLITRTADLNARARAYMAPSFRAAVAHLPRFLVNSAATGDELRRFCRPDAIIELYRPRVRNVFALTSEGRAARTGSALRLVALGTTEPRKNLRAAAAILTELRAGAFPDATLAVIGRPGWDAAAAATLAATPGVVMHGYQEADAVRGILHGADMLITTAHDEGLGLPLLEAQYAGLQVVAPKKPVFAEALGASGLFIDPAAPDAAAGAITAWTRGPDWRARSMAAAADNLARWNAAADQDRVRVIAMLARLSAGPGRAPC